MLSTERKPVSAGEMLTEEFLSPMKLTQGALAAAMGVERKLVKEFWLNVQRRTDLWETLHTPKRRQRIEQARALQVVG